MKTKGPKYIQPDSAKSKKHKILIKTSGDFKNDPEGAIDALAQTGFAIFMITKQWYEDKRAVKEWRYAKDIKKPIIYILQKGVDLQKFLLDANVIGMIVIEKDNVQDSSIYVQSMLAAYCKVNKIEF
jgi:hypothetical protein